MFRLIKSDYKVYNMNPLKLVVAFFTLHPFYLVFLYRISHWLYSNKIPLLPTMVRAFGQFLYGAEIVPSAKIGASFKIAHTNGIVIGGEIGDNFECFHNVTIGGRGRNNNGRELPKIGNNVKAYCGSIIIGPVTIGDNVKIGANCIVINDIPNNCTVVGTNSTRIIKETRYEDSASYARNTSCSTS